MKKFLRLLLGVKESNPAAEEVKEQIDKAYLDSYKQKKIEYAKTLGADKAKYEYELQRKKYDINVEKKPNAFVQWLIKGDAK